MKRIKSLFACSIIILLLGSITQCTNDASVGPELLESPAIASSTTPPPNAAWMSDYLPLNPYQFGIRTFYWYDEDEYSLAFISGTETVPYATGAVEATKVFVGDGDVGMYIDGREFWWGLIQGGYYLSVDCALSDFPAGLVFGKVWDGMFVDLAGTGYLVSPDGSDCIPLSGDDYLFFKIDDLNFAGERYQNALVVWSLEDGAYQPLDFGGWEDEWGLTLPTYAEIGDRVVDAFTVLALRRGIVALGDVISDAGQLEDLGLLVSQVPTASVPVVWASGGGTIDWGQSGRAKYGFNATLDMGGNARGVLQFHWREGGYKWHGVIDCMSVDGNQAYLSGQLTNGEDAGKYFIFSVEDNGEGASATGPDLISVIRVRTTPRDCHGPYQAPFKDWTNGNVKIKLFSQPVPTP
jgi:hypothetical protein